MKKSIIFCQASAKVASVLNCYERELSKQRSVQIVIRNVPNLVKFFKSLNLKAEVLYFDRLYPRKFRIRGITKRVKMICVHWELMTKMMSAFFLQIYLTTYLWGCISNI